MTSRLGLMLLLAGLVGFLTQSAIGQGDEQKAAAPTAIPMETSPSDTRGPAAAAAFVARIHNELRNHPSVKADIEQAVSIGDQQFLVSGRYLSNGLKLRLEYTVKPNQGAEGSLVEVCDGKELWSLMTLAGSKRVTRRDVQQIKAAAASMKAVPDAVLTAELGLGGLTALFASLERTMTFDAIREEEVQGRPCTLVQGHWKSDFVSRWKRKPGDLLPAYVPDVVRIVADSRTLFPERIVYLKKQPDKSKKGYRAMVSLQFKSVEIDAMIDDQEFTFVPPDDVVPDDITRQYLDRLTNSPDGKTIPSPSSESPADGKSVGNR